MSKWSKYSALAGGSAAAIVAALAIAPAAHAQEQLTSFNIPEQPLATALLDLGRQAHISVAAPHEVVAGKTARPVQGDLSTREALIALLDGSGLHYDFVSPTAVRITADPQSGSAAGDGADGTVAALVVTAQKREEQIQDVPIAISAFTEKQLEAQKIEGGFDLLKAIPNVTFSKNNFTSYNFSIRGVGTKAVSATTDPGVAVSFNNIALIQNRLFEQEYVDIERVEVLRGPQGTLYGRNATSGVINVISAKPKLNAFDGWIKGEVGNYHTKRVSAMLNVPLIEDKLAVRFAGALTNREGYDFNEGTHHAVNGRDLWSGRLTVGFKPNENLKANFIWERFREDDNRLRTGKQLCHRDDGPAVIGNTQTALNGGGFQAPVVWRSIFSQGCKAGSLYDDSAFGTPNGLSYNFVLGLLFLDQGLPEYLGTAVGAFPGNTRNETIIKEVDPYGGMMQSRDLRSITSIQDPRYRAGADLLELNVDFDLTPSLTFSSQTAYDKDETYSFQDFNRFNTVPVFTDTSKLLDSSYSVLNPTQGGPSRYANLAPGGIFCDPQIGCSNTIAGFDIAKAKGKQFSQELRLQSSFDGPVNFSLGANYTRFETLVDYYIMFNLLTAMAEIGPFNNTINHAFNPTVCAWSDYWRGSGIVPAPGPVPIGDPTSACPYIDPNPVDSLGGDGHNYFRSVNPYKLKSAAGFGELYWNVTDTLKMTAGLRYTDDTKTVKIVPSQLLLAANWLAGGAVSRGYPETSTVKQNWGEWTGRLGFDWTPDISFTDHTLLYAFYSHGYKGGGTNPPKPGYATLQQSIDIATVQGTSQDIIDYTQSANFFPVLELTANEYSDTFKPEFVNAFEVGAKNTLLGGGLTLNATGFYYDYKDYQVSQIRDRTAVNENFDASIWGVELEGMFAPNEHLQVVANFGYLDTKIAAGERSIDIMNRTQGILDDNGNPKYVVVKPWAQLPSNCVVPAPVAESWLHHAAYYWAMCGGWNGLFSQIARPPIDPATNAEYNVANYPELNGGAGILADLGGNELPNAPHWTANIGVQYGFGWLNDWRVTVRGDAYWQSQSWARVYNLDPYDKLHGWYNANVSLWIERPDDGLKIELYAKNVLDDTPITDAFLNSDDTGLTTNVFVLDPRLIGLSIRKEF